MSQVELLGPRADLETLLTLLQDRRIAEIVDLTGTPAPVAASSVQADLEVVDAVLAWAPRVLGDAADLPGVPVGDESEDATGSESDTTLAADLLRALADLDTQAATRATESERLTRQLGVLEPLEELVPELASMSDAELIRLDLATVALVLEDPHRQVVGLLRAQFTELLGDRQLLVTTASTPQSSQDHTGVLGCLLVVARADLAAVESLLGADRIARVSVAEGYGDRSLHTAVAAMRSRLAVLPAERDAISTRRIELLVPHLSRLRQLRLRLIGQAERERAGRAVVTTAHTFALRLWVPTPRLEELTAALTGQSVVMCRINSRRVVGEPPTLLHTRRTWQPYQRLVSFLSWPAPGGLDPSGLMAVTLPFLFGVMVGDVAYGVLLMLLGGWLTRGRLRRQPLAVDAGQVLLVGGAWATLFGFVFGEFLGNLGNTLGMPALWFYRGGPAALEPLLLFALALGAAHVILGLVLGIFTAARARQRSRLADRIGTFLVLIGLFGLAGVLARALPDLLLTPAVAIVVIGTVLACVSHGALGLLLGPLELLGAIGNVLSYLRVAAVGLASVYLANVANTLGAEAPLVLGLIVAVFFHTLNLALAAFSPTVQALRLHYVEFFSKFYDGGGRPFSALGAHLDPATPSPRTPSPSPSPAVVSVVAAPSPTGDLPSTSVSDLPARVPAGGITL